MKNQIWNKEGYITYRTKYWLETGIPDKKSAIQLATKDWYEYCEKCGYDTED
jgi:hypothetical protein